jgi:hypothetical protein
LSTLTGEVKTFSDPNCKEFRFTGPNHLEGIINFVTAKHGGNVHDKRIVEVRSSSRYSDSYYEKNVVDLTTDTKFGSKGEPGNGSNLISNRCESSPHIIQFGHNSIAVLTPAIVRIG